MAFHGTHFKHEIREFDVADMMFGQRLDDWIAAADGMDAAQGEVADIIDGFVVCQINAKDVEPSLRFDIAEKHVLNGERLDFGVGRRGVLIAWWVALVLTERFDARRCDVDADSAVADDEIAEGAVAHEIVMRPADADAVARALQNAICDSDVLTGLRLVELLLHAADDDAVVAVREIAVADDDVAAGAEMDAVAVGHAEVCLHRHAANADIFAVEEPREPAGGINKRKVFQTNVFAANKEQAAARNQLVMLPFPVAFKRLEIFIDMDEIEALEIDLALSADADMGNPFAVHDVAFVVAKRITDFPIGIWLDFRIKFGIRSSEEDGVPCDFQTDIAFQTKRIEEIFAGSDENRAATICGARINGLLECFRTVEDSVADGAEIADVIDFFHVLFLSDRNGCAKAENRAKFRIECLYINCILSIFQRNSHEKTESRAIWNLP